jgi:hydroxymethylglutaryl-CoA lyase
MNLLHTVDTTLTPQPITSLPGRAEINEVGLRDGLQTLDTAVPIQRKIAIVEALIAAGVKQIQVTSFVHPKRVPQMADAEALCARLPEAAGVTYSALVLNLRGVERAEAAGIGAVDMGVASTESLSHRNANCSVSEGLERLATMVERARQADMRVRAGVQSAFGCAYEGEVPQARVVELVEHILSLGIDELTLADSTGMANPLQIEGMISAISPLARDCPIVLHLHDTRGMGLANVYAALRWGVVRFDTAFGGLGGCPFIEGATGNIASEDTLYLMHQLGIETGVDLNALAAISRDFESFLGRPLPAKLHRLMGR